MENAKARRYWVNTVSLDHVLAGQDGGFTQADHGKSDRLSRLQRSDYLVFYSPKTALKSGEPVQCFTAMGEIIDALPYQVSLTDCFQPWRRQMRFWPVQQAPIRSLISSLQFIENPRYWGFPFRRGLFEISASDFQVIAQAMQANATSVLPYSEHAESLKVKTTP